MGSSAWKWAAPLAALVLAIAAGGIAAVLLLADREKAREEFARFVPADVELFVTLNLDPSHPQAALREEFVARVGAADGSAVDFADLLQRELNVFYADDVEPWIGGEVAVMGRQGLLVGSNGAIDNARWCAMTRVSNRGAAVDFLDYMAALLNEPGAESGRDAGIDGAELWAIEGAYFALSGDFLLLSTDRRTLIEALRDVQVPPSSPLAEDETYLEARAALPSEGSMFLFMRLDELGVEELLGLEGALPDAELTGDYLAASLSFIDSGLHLEFATPAVEGMLPGAAVSETLDLLPADAIVAVSTSIPQDAWDLLLATPGTEEALADMERAVGIDLQDDVLGALGDELALALRPSDFGIDEWGALQGAIDILLFLELSNDARLESELYALLSLAEGFGLPVERETAGGREIISIPLGLLDSGLEGMDLGYVIDDGMLAVGSVRDSLKNAGDGPTLRDADTFRQAAGLLPSELATLVYVDIEAAMEMLEDTGLLDGLLGDLFGDASLGAPFDAAPFSTLVIAGPVPEDGIGRSHIVLTLAE